MCCLLKACCRSCTCSIEIFSSTFARNIHEQMVTLIQSRTLELYWKQTFKTCEFNEDILSICVKLNTITHKKEPEKCTFTWWCFKKKGHLIFRCWDLVVVCNPLSKFPATRLGIWYSRFKRTAACRRLYIRAVNLDHLLHMTLHISALPLSDSSPVAD